MDFDMQNFKTIKNICINADNDNGNFKFEIGFFKVDIVSNNDENYLYVHKAYCTAENNGRPVSRIEERCIFLGDTDINNVNSENWEKLYFHYYFHKKSVLLKEETFFGILPDEYYQFKNN